MMHRRSFLSGTGALLGAGALGCGRVARGPLEVADLAREAAPPWQGLVRSLPEEHDYVAEVEGRLPAELRGSLYRNGPGLFERGGLRKRALLDGDGMLQCFDFGETGVRFRNRFTRTEKWLAEQEAGAYRYATWTTQAPGGRFSNLLGMNMANQAGVSVHRMGDALYAFDESALPHRIDPATLETLGLSRMGVPDDVTTLYAAHPKRDGRTGEWLLFGLAYGRGVTVHLTGFDAAGRFTSHKSFELPRYAYLHDFFVTDDHVVFNVHPANFRILDFLLGSTSLVGALRWEPEQGNLVVVLPRHGDAEPLLLEAEPHWMWHAMNAYERGGEIVAEFVGADDPADFIGEDPALFAAMEGRMGEVSPSRLRRYVIDPAGRRLRLETLSDADYEFPMINPVHAGHANRFGYLARSTRDDLFWTQVARYDMESGAEDVYDFGAGRYCAEPVFAPLPGRDYGNAAEEPGWLLTEVYDAARERSFLAVLRADRVAEGPVALVHLRHHVPLSFHGTWVAA